MTKQSHHGNPRTSRVVPSFPEMTGPMGSRWKSMIDEVYLVQRVFFNGCTMLVPGTLGPGITCQRVPSQCSVNALSAALPCW